MLVTGSLKWQLYTGFISTERTLITLYYPLLIIMKKQLSCVLLATSIFALNALPVQAAKKTKISRSNKQLVAFSGQWCFELPWMGLFCYDL